MPYEENEARCYLEADEVRADFAEADTRESDLEDEKAEASSCTQDSQHDRESGVVNFQFMIHD